ncbi:hypothetical protein S40293_11283 [Stachybotrys chartarum IBT 40293]|nr:hypothetical protein S40293_11283 [Stachybotrys chartarum IBT 40293]
MGIPVRKSRATALYTVWLEIPKDLSKNGLILQKDGGAPGKVRLVSRTGLGSTVLLSSNSDKQKLSAFLQARSSAAVRRRNPEFGIRRYSEAVPSIDTTTKLVGRRNGQASIAAARNGDGGARR